MSMRPWADQADTVAWFANHKKLWKGRFELTPEFAKGIVHIRVDTGLVWHAGYVGRVAQTPG